MPLELRVASGKLSPGQVRRLLGCAVGHPRDYLLLRLLYFTGLRRAEVVALRVGDILWEIPALFIRSGKDDKDRYVLLDPTTCELLRSYVQGVELRREIFPHTGKWVHDTFLIYGNRSGLIGEFQSQGLRLSPHSLRYAFASHLYNNGLSLELLAELMGHDLMSDTALYVAPPLERMEAAYEACQPLAEGPGLSPPRLPPLRIWGNLWPDARAEIEDEFRHQSAAARTNGLPALATPGEIGAVLEACDRELYRFCRFLYASGLRWERALSMSAAELDEVLVDRETRSLLSGGFELAAERVEAEFLACCTRTGLAQRMAAIERPVHLDVLRSSFAIHCATHGMDPISLMSLLGLRYYTSAQRYLQAATVGFAAQYRRALDPRVEP